MIDYTAFKEALPEFSDPVRFPKSSVEFWIPHAYAQINASRFGAELDLGATLFVAHEVALEARAAAEAARGAIPGAATGIVNSKSVDKVSVGYDTTSVAAKGAGYYNTTIYGMRFWRMREMYSRGPVYRAPCAPLYRFPFP